MNLRGKKVLVLGLGITGEAVCHFLLTHGAQVKVSEKKGLQELGEKIAFWGKKGIVIEAGEHKQKSFKEADFIVPSPGVPPLPELMKAKEFGVKVISEIELAYNFLKGKIVGITGSNGKSTTASLVNKILKEGGLQSYLAGNIGTPLISFVENSKKDDIYVTEISSFQLKYIENFRVYLSVFLNVSVDHLDWHPSFADYYQAKKKLVTFQKENEMAILNQDDPLVWNLYREAKSKVYPFSRKMKVNNGCFLKGDWIVFSDKKEKRLMKTSEIPLLGSHNQENVMAAALVGYLFGLPLEQTRKSIKNFKGLEHRLERVAAIKGVNFYNDSKATNIDATLKSMESFKQKIILILGGRDKGGDFKKLISPIQKKVKKIILIGEAAGKIRNALNKAAPMSEVSSLREAVKTGFSEANPGEVILLAPACTSFDMFKNFEERGEIFKHEVFDFKRKMEKEKA